MYLRFQILIVVSVSDWLTELTKKVNLQTETQRHRNISAQAQIQIHYKMTIFLFLINSLNF